LLFAARIPRIVIHVPRADRRLADQFHLVAPDYPGFGHSDAPANTEFSYTFDRLTDVVEKFTESVSGSASTGCIMQDFGGRSGSGSRAAGPNASRFLVVQNANAYEEGLPDSFWGAVRELWNDPSAANRAKIAQAAMSAEALEWNYTHASVTQPNQPGQLALQKRLLARPATRTPWWTCSTIPTNPPLYPVAEYLRSISHRRWPSGAATTSSSRIRRARVQERPTSPRPQHCSTTGHFALEDHSEEIAAHINDSHSRSVVQRQRLGGPWRGTARTGLRCRPHSSGRSRRRRARP